MTYFKYPLWAAIIGTFVWLAGLLVEPAQAETPGYSSDNIAKISILPGWRQADGTHMAALRIELADGWKTYWRAPGEGGIAPTFDWSGSRNMQNVVFHWPVPQVFDTAGLQTLGYYHELILPFAVSPKRLGQKITLKGSVFLGVCSDVCMPMEARFDTILEVGAPASDAPLIRQALGAGPISAREAGLGGITCDVAPISDGLRVTARMGLPRVGAGEFVVIEPADQGIWVSQAKVSRQGRTLTAVSDLVPPSGAPFVLSRSDIRITVLAAGRGVDIASCVFGS